MDEEPTNPVEGEALPEVETEVQDEPQLDDDGNPIDQPEPEEDEEEVDLDDLKLKLPKEQAEKLRQAALRQADYTRKTQELAETRKAFEAEREAITKADEREQSVRVNIALLDNQIAQLSQVNWNAYFDAEPFEAQKQFAHYQNVQNARRAAGDFLGSITQERQSKEQQANAQAAAEFAKLMDQGTPAIKKAIPDWNSATSAKLVKEAIDGYGFTREEMTGIDERIILALSDAAKWRAHQATTKKTQAIQKQQEVQPAAKATRSNPPPTGLSDKLTADEWAKRRNAQLRARA